MFVSRETQEKIQELEEENARLQAELSQWESNSSNGEKKWVRIAIVMAVVAVLAIGASIWLWVNRTPALPTVEVITSEGEGEWVYPLDEGLTYHVQIGAFESFDLSSYGSALEGIYLFENDSLQRISLGAFKSFEQAQQFQNDLQKLEMPFAYITAYKDGQAIALMRAREIEDGGILE